MIRTSIFRQFIILLPLFSLLACQGKMSDSSFFTQEDTMSNYTDIAELTKYVQLPAPPQNVYWQTYQKSTGDSDLGPTDWELIAVLVYDTTVLQQLEGQMTEQTHPTELFVSPAFLRDWFPESVKSRFVQDGAYPEYLKLDGMRYEPVLFAQAPLTNGYVFIADNLLFLFLYTS